MNKDVDRPQDLFRLKLYIFTFYEDLKTSLIDLSVIVGIIAIYQFGILRTVPENLPAMVVGLLFVAVGLALFLRGLELGIFPLGEDLAQQLARMPTRVWIVVFAFVIGFATTIAEPALIAIAHKAAVISNGQIDALTLRLVVALSVGFAIVIGVIRILVDHPIHWYIIAGYVLVISMTAFSPEEIVGLAYDSGGITTSTVTVPLIAALGIGLTSSLKNRNPLLDGFGLIAFASVMPMIFVQGYGILAYVVVADGGAPVETRPLSETAPDSSVWGYVEMFLGSIGDVLPVVVVILTFYWGVLRRPIANFGMRAAGFGVVVLGLYFFVIGLEMGLFPVGESLAVELAGTGNRGLIYSFAFAIGFATTIAEPALTAIARKAEEISDGSIRQNLLRVFVALGVGVGILLGAYRIIQGGSIVYYVMAGYLVVIVMTAFAPRTIIPVAYDSGGVTTSTITVPIVAALGLGLAETIPDRDPLVDGFGLIAFASLFPMVAVLAYGISKREAIRRHKRRIEQLEQRVMSSMKRHLDSDGIEDQDYLDTLQLQKKPIVTITGETGSGVTTVTRGLAEALEYRRFSAGGLFRNVARQHNMTVEELNDYAGRNRAIDREIDTLIRQLGEGSEIVLDARLGYYWIHDSFRVYLTVDPDVAARRICDDINEGLRHEEGAGTIDQVIVGLRTQAESTRRRYLHDYGIDIDNTRNFDLIINTDDRTPAEVVQLIKEAYRKWLRGGG
jgi:predicted cytidylate kinase